MARPIFASGRNRGSLLSRLTKRISHVWLSPWLLDIVLLAILASFGLYLISGMFRSGMMYQFDHSQHLVESYFDATVLIPKYHQLIGWNPYYYLGYPQGQFNPPMGYAVFAALYYGLSWGLSSLEIYKVMIAGFYILPGFTLYFAARVFGLSRISGFFAGLIAMGTAGGFEQSGPVGMMEYGMYEYAGAIALIPLIFALYHLAFQRKSWLLIMTVGFLTAFDFLLHTIAGIFLLIILTVYTLSHLGKQLLFHRRDLQVLRTGAKYAIVILITLGLSSFWLIPAYTNQSYYTSQKSLVTELGNYGMTYNDIINGLVFGEKATYYSPSVIPQSNPQIIISLYNSQQLPSHYPDLLFYQVLMVLAAIGIALAIFKRKSRFPAFVALVCIGVFFFISLGPTYYEVLWQSKLFHLIDIRPARAIAPARILLALLAGVGIGDGLIFVTAKIPERNSATLIASKYIAIAIITIFAISLVANSLTLMPKMNLGATTNDYSTASTLPQLFSWLNQNVPNSSRIAFEEYPGSDQHLFAISPMFTGKQIVGSDYNFWWSSGAAAAQSASTVLAYANIYSTSEVVTTLSGLNAGYLVAWKTQTKFSLQDFSQLSLVKQFGIFNVYELKGYIPSYVNIVNGTGKAVITEFQPETIAVHVSNVSAKSDLLIKIAYYGSWVASSNGSPVALSPVTIRLPLASAVYMEVPLSKSGTYNITLQYAQTTSDIAGNDLTGISMVFSALGFAFIATNGRYDIQLSEHIARSTRKAMDMVRSILIRSRAHSTKQDAALEEDRNK
ncbi:MAG: hypothetical protein ACYC7D_11650 [Nitrososphaerales archaeon]